MNVYHRKLYAFLRSIESIAWLNTDISYIYDNLTCLQPHLPKLQDWWQNNRDILTRISSSSDKINLNSTVTPGDKNNIKICHPISGQTQSITISILNQQIDITDIAKEENVKKVFWWFWRYFPEKLAHQDANNAFLTPTHRILPDCPLHSYQSTVSALTGALFHKSAEPHPVFQTSLSLSRRRQDLSQGKNEHQVLDESCQEDLNPYLFLFTFSPVQEFIKASRKFLDFWSGSYLLHYFSAFLCFEIAKIYGADAIITPSLWNQEIIDALIWQDEDLVISNLRKLYHNPAEKFQNNPENQSLSTAGFPNVITVLVPNQAEATKLGKHLDRVLKNKWLKISQKVRKAIKNRVINLLQDKQKLEQILTDISPEFPNYQPENLSKELQQLSQHGCWEWNKLWDTQIENTWETYFVGVPFGYPQQPLEIDIKNLDANQRQQWIDWQNHIARATIELPTQAEINTYTKNLNVGTWWGSLQARLGNAIQAVKNTRAWQTPVAPGERSTLSGFYSAVHPRFIYQQFPNGLGMPSESLRLFWHIMGLAFPGLFNGSEKLNAIELSKRMAWKHGGVGESLGIRLQQAGENNSNHNDDEDYEGLIRFPNFSSIAAANYATHHPEKIAEYWQDLRRKIYQDEKLKLKHDKFCSRTRRPFHVKRADAALKENIKDYSNGYNGVILSAKWLADDMGLDTSETNILRTLVDETQKQHFADNNPSDWWVLVLGDGDGMGGYVNGRKLKFYDDYILEKLVDKKGIDEEIWQDLLTKTKKRMGPATHVGLNRALLDFSNRLVPYITEQRCCGRVIYSGGDDVMVALSSADLPKFLRSLRAAWCGKKDPENEFNSNGGYWQWNPDNPQQKKRPNDIPSRPLFTMGKEATMSLGIVIAHKSVPLPTVLEKIWDAEKEGGKKMIGGVIDENNSITDKDGLCFPLMG